MESKIPKIIHYCWFGKGEETELMKKCLESWEIHLSDYKIVRWDETKFDVNRNRFTKEAYENKKWAFVSDYVRLFALNRYGGVYLDTDVEIIKNLDVFLAHDGFLGYECEEYLSTGVIGASKNNNWIKLLLDYYSDKNFVNKNGSFNEIPNTKIITEILKVFNFDLKKGRQILKNGIEIYPKDFFSPKNYYSGEIELTKHSCTIHHFNGSWMNNNMRFKHKVHKTIIKILGKSFHSKLRKILKKKGCTIGIIQKLKEKLCET